LPLLGIILVALFGFVPRAFSQCANPPNAIVAENCLTGTPSSSWDINGQGTGDLTGSQDQGTRVLRKLLPCGT
jgi:hypothetical protein